MWPDDECLRQDVSTRPSTSSDSAAIDSAIVGPPFDQAPSVANMNFTNSKKIHIGHKIIKVTQNVHNNDVVKGRFLCLELVSPAKGNRLRCSVAVFVCWAIVVTIGISVYFLCFALNRPPSRLKIDLNATWYLSRDDWQALSEYSLEVLKLPVKYVVIGHSATEYCDVKSDCIKKMIAIQQDHLRRLSDIGPNYLVGGNGFVFEGRGANILGAMLKGWNSKIISIMFIGDYRKDKPDQAQFDHVTILINKLIEVKVLQQDYELFGYCQLNTETIPPGPNLMDNLMNFSHWNDTNANKCIDLPLPRYLWELLKNTTTAERITCAMAILLVILCNVFVIIYFTVIVKKIDSPDNNDGPREFDISRDQWLARSHNKSDLTSFRPVKLVVVQHTVSNECHTFLNCAAEMRNIQDYYLDSPNFGYDIPYNFVIGNDGRVYEGRGWGVVGAHTKGYNLCSLGIAFVGDYREEEEGYTKVTEAQLNRSLALLEKGVKLGYLDPSHVIVGAKDLQVTASPGSNLYDAIRQWTHYDHLNRYRNKTCSDIDALSKPNTDHYTTR